MAASTMSAADPRTAVLIGAGQLNQRVDKGADPVEPVGLMAEALRRAEADSTRSGVLASADSIRAISQLSWRYRDPARLVGEAVGARPAETAYTVMGGNYVQTVVNRTALDILEGRNDLVLLCGGEAWRTNRAAKKSGQRPDWTRQGEEVTPTHTYGEGDPDLSHPAEVAQRIGAPIQVYPMLDNALRAAQGLSLTDQRRRIADLWARFSEVAADNPHAWSRRSYRPDEIGTPASDNRLIGWPYTKRLNSNNAVEQGAGLILCSVERAHELGVPRERWVFVRSGADAHDHWYVSHRADLHSSPAIRLAGRAALDLAGVGIDDVAHIDLYSCFPSAVQIAAAELGLGLERPLTVTGGMSFAGGPWNNYVMHAIATMADVLRNDPGAAGLVTANGGFTTKHAFGVYSTEPPHRGRFGWANPQGRVDALPSRDVAESWEGPVEIEAYTVMFDRGGEPETGPCACLLADGRRAWGNVHDPAVLRAMTESEFVGRSARRLADGTIDPVS